MLDPLVVARNVSRSFPAGDNAVRRVLQDVNCLVFPGDRVAVAGPSGSGKSTLLAILAGLDGPSSGEVRWPGLAPNLTSRRSRRCHVRPGDPFLSSADTVAGADRRSRERPPGISVVFQSPSLLPALDVRQNVLLPLLLTGETKGIEGRARQLLEFFEVLELADKLPGELSGGQAQRVAVARAWMTQPRLLLADEPTGQLDHATAGRMLDAMFLLASQRRTAIVIASHDEAIAARMEKTWRLDHGCLMTAKVQETSA